MVFEKESFDILNCVHLFHELPKEVRRECAKEFFRVLKPGGLLCFNDSIQAGDRQGITQEELKFFSDNAHEPNYLDYIQDDLKALFEEAGFKQFTEPAVASQSKVLSFIKPEKSALTQSKSIIQENAVKYGPRAPETIMSTKTQSVDEMA